MKYNKKDNENKHFVTLKNYLKIKKIIIIYILFVIVLFIFSNNIRNIINPSSIIKKSSKTKVAMCARAKLENRYIKYFVEYYKKLGYDHMYLYDNNGPNNEALADVDAVKEGINNGFITIIDYKESSKYHVGNRFYNCYARYNKLYDWISFFDIDEFLILLPRNSTIQSFMESPRYKNCQLVRFNWKVFNDNGQLDYVDKPLMERFRKQTKYKFENRHVKSIVRGGLNYHKFKKTGPHSIYGRIKACTVSGKKANSAYYRWPPDHKFGWLNHYVTKSVSEFFYKKFKNKVNVNKISKRKKKSLFNYFFLINKKTKEKVAIFNKIFNSSFH